MNISHQTGFYNQLIAAFYNTTASWPALGLKVRIAHVFSVVFQISQIVGESLPAAATITELEIRSGDDSDFYYVSYQYYWGQRVFELGVGPRYFTRRQMTATRLAEAFTQALTNADMRRKAAALGAAIRAEPDGVAEAVSGIAHTQR